MLFDSGAFPWSLQGQVVLLSSADVAPPDIHGVTLRDLVSDDWSRHATRLRDAGVLAVLRPGVDGAVAGVLSLDVAFETAWLRALDEQARRAGFTCEITTEEQFWLAL